MDPGPADLPTTAFASARVDRTRPASHRYTLTAKGLRVAMWFTRCHSRLFRPALGEIFADEFPDDTPLRRALDRFDQEVNRCIDKAKVPVAT